jgi:uncharacterized protein
MDVSPFETDSDPPVRGFLHPAEGPPGASPSAIVLTHGAGSNCQAPLLVAVARALASAGVTVLRCDLPYRQKRPHGPPFPGQAAQDRAGLRNAVEALKSWSPAVNEGISRDRRPLARVFLGGHSYGGRQATMLASEDPGLAGGLLLLSYPLHPPNQPQKLRTDHFPSLRTDALFVSGTRDPFGSIEEIEHSLKLIPARTALRRVEGAGHDLGGGRRARGGPPDAAPPLPQAIVEAFLAFFAITPGL